MYLKPICSSVFFLFLLATIKAQNINFVDANLKKMLVEVTGDTNVAFNQSQQSVAIDLNQDGEISQIEASLIYILDVSFDSELFDDKVTDITGIFEFQNLEELDISGHHLTGLTIENQTNLSKLSCGLNLFTFLEIRNLPVLDTLIVSSLNSSNAFCDLKLSNLPNLVYLDFESNRCLPELLDDITSLVELRGKNGYGFQIDTLDLSLMTNLEYVDLEGNGLIELFVPLNNNIRELYLLSNDFITFDKSFFSKLEVLDISLNYLTQLDVSNMELLRIVNCEVNDDFISDNEFVDLKINGCINLEYLLCGGNSLQNLDANGLYNLEVLSAYSNPLKTINLRSNFSLVRLDIRSSEIENLDLSCSPNLTKVNATFNDNLKFVNLKNGTIDDPSFYYFELDSLNAIAVDYNEILEKFIDIPQSQYVTFSPSCSPYFIEGEMQMDINDNGCDETDPFLAYHQIFYGAELDRPWTYSNGEGKYNIYTGLDSLELIPFVDENIYENWNFGMDSIYTQEFFNTDSVTIDFCLIPDGIVEDLEIYLIPTSESNAGFEASYTLIYKNVGNQIMSGEIGFSYPDSTTTFVSSIPDVDEVQENYLKWNYENLLPFEERQIEMTLQLNSPMDLPPLNGTDTLIYQASIGPSINDKTRNNNTSGLIQQVINSYDPNDIRCLEGEQLDIKKIGNALHYVIRFENLGNASAKNVVIQNPIDQSKLEINTVKLISSSHDVKTHSRDSLVEFVFEDINLSFEDELNDGYVLYSINSKSNLVLDDTIKNSAEIYFDFNFPVSTNNYITVVSENVLSSTSEINTFNSSNIFPNPFKNAFIIQEELGSYVRIYNARGDMIFSKKINTNPFTIQANSWNGGLYYLRLEDSKRNRPTYKLLKLE